MGNRKLCASSYICTADSSAFETRWNLLVTLVEKNAERYRNVKVYSENVSPKSSAETNRSLKISQTLD
ncbi:unnamed protein product [Thlaspi arvense]|uniref:Uncharacterized protein n=1 Tax=Thlaspi arvense TaxID=13288 RepID=A0AAU9SW21_THLAR|nr:unnamed protein product [Thlaspi arvense]